MEAAVRFRSDVAGTISGIRFYKCAGNTDVHIGTLWTNSGTNLATALFTVASYHTNVGRYGVTDSYFAMAGHDRAHDAP